MDFSLRISPNNEVVIGVQSIAKKQKKSDDTLATLRKDRFAKNYNIAALEIVQGLSGGAVLNHWEGSPNKVVTSREVVLLREERKRSLDIIREVQAKANGDKKEKNDRHFFFGRPGHGVLSDRPTVFTRLARHRILAGGACIERASDDPSLSTFVTLTIPGDTPRARVNVAMWASHITNCVLQAIRDSRRKLERKPEYFYCWEFQKRGMLHLHCVVFHPESGVSYSVAQAATERWYRCLKKLSARGIDLFSRRGGRECWLPQFWQFDVSPVRKSVANYISKYVSKSAPIKEHPGCPKGEPLPAPPRWWGMSRNLLREIESQSSELSIDGLTETDCCAIAEKVCSELERKGVLILKSQYSFDINHGSFHAGHGFRFIYYLDGNAFLLLRNLLASVVAAACSTITYGYGVRGSNWLWKQFSNKPIVAPPFSLFAA